MSESDLLAPLLAEPSRTGVFTDFDGTLSPIVDDPDDARPLEGAAEVLAALAGRMGRVGVISGRPAAFLLTQLGGDTGVSMWGLHGLECVENGRVVPDAEAEPWRDTVEEVVARARQELADVAEVEDKNVAITVHFRRAPGEGARVRGWVEAIAAETGLAVHPGRMSYELRPPIAHGKGLALERAAEGLTAACFFGDDVGDADAFSALDRLEERGVAVLRVAVRSEEAPEDLIERADLVVDGPEGVLELLRALSSS